MSKARLSDMTGATIRPGSVIVYPSRQGNTVRQSEAVVLETKSDKQSGRVMPILRVRPTGRDSGFIKRKTLVVQDVSSQHAVVIGHIDD